MNTEIGRIIDIRQIEDIIDNSGYEHSILIF